jgi:hypothetical protein
MYQIHKDGKPIDEIHEILGPLCAECLEVTDGRYVVEVDVFDDVVRRFTVEESKRSHRICHVPRNRRYPRSGASSDVHSSLFCRLVMLRTWNNTSDQTYASYCTSS